MNTKHIQHITWNTGRSYSPTGQRMGAFSVEQDGKHLGVIAVDVDRGIEYYLPDCPLRPSAIMARYDANERCEYRPESMPINQFVAIRDWLIDQAKHPAVSGEKGKSE